MNEAIINGGAGVSYAAVVDLPEETLLQPSTTPSPGPLSLQSLGSLRAAFARRNHRPGAAMWRALERNLSVLEAMADGACEARVYLSSLDPGVGKTQSIVHFIRALLSSPAHQDVGVLLCIGRLDEIEGLASTLGLRQEDFAVLTSDADLNQLGNGRPGFARVLFTTHAMVERRCTGRNLAEASELWFNGEPRTVRIWDEAIMPAKGLTLGRDELSGLLQPLRLPFPKLATVLDRIIEDLRTATCGQMYSLPNVEAEADVTLEAVGPALRPDQQQSLTTVWKLQNRTVTVRKERYGVTVLDYEDTLPPDIAPVLVLDASGRVRGTYAEWERVRGGLHRLPAAPKRYDRLRVHVWETGGGKSAFRQRGEQLAQGIAKAIASKPNEEWLVVHHKDRSGQNLRQEVRTLVGEGPKVHFLTWGRHDATNQYAHVSNVILAGTLFYPAAYYEALGRAAAGRSSKSGPYPKQAQDRVRLGEHLHLVLQAAGRGALRRCDGDQCAPCDLYVIASKRSGIPGALKEAFPGCQVERWNPMVHPLRGKVEHATRFIIDRLDREPDRPVPFSLVQRVVGIGNPANFRKNVRLHPEFIDALAAAGIVEHGLGRRKTGFINGSFLFAEQPF